MTVTLLSDPNKLIARFGLEFWDRLTYPGIFRGAPRLVTPVLLSVDDAETIVISDSDSDAAQALPGDIDVATYGRYFRWDDVDGTRACLGFGATLHKVVGDREVLCDPDLPVARFQDLADFAKVSLSGFSPSQDLVLHRKSKSEIVAQWRHTRDADAERLQDLIAKMPHGNPLAAALLRPIEGYAALDWLVEEVGVGAVMITAPHEVEMFSGLPAEMNRQLGLIAIWVSGDDILIAAPKQLPRSDFRAEVPARPLADLLLGKGTVAVQKNDMSIGRWSELTSAGLDLCGGDEILCRFQDLRAGEDLIYFIVAGNAMLEGIAAARRAFGRHGRNGMSERDLVGAHRIGARRYLSAMGFEGRDERCFDIVHSGARTHLPATASDAIVTDQDVTIKFDMGIFLKDAAGCVRGVSDIARTICTDPNLAQMHDLMRRSLVKDLIPRIRPGMTGADVYAEGLKCLAALESELRAAGLLPDGCGVDGYSRDCGHTLQRQTISSVYFLPNNSKLVEEGMLGCVEYVWPIGDILLAVEDGYYVASDKTVPFTHEEKE
ncbi:M24 family metallopeptidase [Roseovarius sp. 2305UL8-3]|uniref:M24 family metallopeptidase n=1 Tax=Roseovarius conchicola TaxID=3121636 RepID=UPI003529D16D